MTTEIITPADFEVELPAIRPHDDIDFEAWFSGEVEKPCGFSVSYLPMGALGLFPYQQCRVPANWLAAYTPQCPCITRRHEYLCDEHRDSLVAQRAVCVWCSTPVIPKLIERLRAA